MGEKMIDVQREKERKKDELVSERGERVRREREKVRWENWREMEKSDIDRASVRK